MVHYSEYEACFKALMDVLFDSMKMHLELIDDVRRMGERMCTLEQSHKERIVRLELEIARHRKLLDIAETRQRLSEIPANPRPGTEG